MVCFASETSTHRRALRLEDEACQILRDSTSAKDILLVCSHFPFQYLDIPLGILSSRRTKRSLTDGDELVLREAEETLRKKATECDSCSWNWQWSPPFASSTMGPTRAAHDIDEDFSKFTKMTFMALERNASGLQSRAVEDILHGLDHVRLLLQYRFNELNVSKMEYEEVEKELKNPLARWIFSSSLHSGSPDASAALASVLHPIKELFENQELSLMSVLQRLKVLEVLYQDILDGLDPRWEGLSEEDFCFLEDLSNHTPWKLAGILIEKDSSCSQKFHPNHFLCPAELRSKSPQWSTLVHTVRVCAMAHPDLVCRIDKAAKILLNHRNFFSGMALVYGLCEANYPPQELWWKHFTVRDICMVYRVRGWLLRLPQYIEDDASSKPNGAEARTGRSCTGVLPKITSTLFVTLFGTQQNMTGRPYISDRPFKHKEDLSRKQVDSMAGESWNDSSTMAGREVGPKKEQGRSWVENMGSVASNLVLSGLANPGQTVSNPSHADDHDHADIGADTLVQDSDSDSALGLDRRDSTTTLSSEAFRPVEKYGRGYHRYQKGKYLLPNDEGERDRLGEQSPHRAVVAKPI